MANPDTGELMQPVLIDSYKSMPIPFGWPFRYIVPDSFARNLNPLSSNGDLILTGPTTISRTAIVLNIILVFVNAACLALLLQAYARRFSMMTFLALPVVFAVLIVVGQLIGSRGIGLAWGFFTMVYFLPSLALLTYHSLRYFLVTKQVVVKDPVEIRRTERSG